MMAANHHYKVLYSGLNSLFRSDRIKQSAQILQLKAKAEEILGMLKERLTESVDAGRVIFDKLNLKVGDYTNWGQILKIDDKTATFTNIHNGKSTIGFGIKNGSKLSYSDLKKLSKVEYDKALAAAKKSKDASMKDFYEQHALSEAFTMSPEGKHYDKLTKVIRDKGKVINKANSSDLEKIAYKDYEYWSYGGGYSSSLHTKRPDGKVEWEVDQVIIGDKDKTTFDGISKADFMKLKIF
jgi:hypothetical protein